MKTPAPTTMVTFRAVACQTPRCRRNPPPGAPTPYPPRTSPKDKVQSTKEDKRRAALRRVSYSVPWTSYLSGADMSQIQPSRGDRDVPPGRPPAEPTEADLLERLLRLIGDLSPRPFY